MLSMSPSPAPLADAMRERRQLPNSILLGQPSTFSALPPTPPVVNYNNNNNNNNSALQTPSSSSSTSVQQKQPSSTTTTTTMNRTPSFQQQQPAPAQAGGGSLLARRRSSGANNARRPVDIESLKLSNLPNPDAIREVVIGRAAAADMIASPSKSDVGSPDARGLVEGGVGGGITVVERNFKAANDRRPTPYPEKKCFLSDDDDDEDDDDEGEGGNDVAVESDGEDDETSHDQQ
ncbi:hypothetical protein T439DRAFT_327107 [Meredithblackwellia eburnea MCA 4105]